MKGFHPRPVAPDTPKKANSEIAYQELRTRILHGDLTPGTILSESAVAGSLGVSRTPVRQAFGELLSRGLLESSRGQQVTVTTPSPQLLEELRMVSTCLEPTIAGVAAEQITQSEIDQLQLVMIQARRAVEACNHIAFFDRDDEFHLQLAHAAGWYFSGDIICRTRELQRIAWAHTEWSRDDLAAIADHHDRIISALAERDPDRSTAAMLRHVST